MKKIVFRNGIYTVFRPLCYVCKVFGLASYSFVADRRNKRVTADYGYWNYMFTVIWLIVFTVGLPAHILQAYSVEVDSQTLYITFVLYVIYSYISTIMVLVWVSFIKRRKFLEVIEKVAEVDNKIRYTLQEETYMNRNMMINVISEIILLTVIQFSVIIHNVYTFKREVYYTLILEIICIFATYICNTLFLFQYLNLVFMVKQRYSHLNKRLTNWISGTVSRPNSLNKGNEDCSLSNMAVDRGILTTLFVSSFGNTQGTLRQTDIHLLRQIYSELYDIICLINDTYSIPILLTMCWLLTTILCCLYETLVNFNRWAVTDIVYVITCLSLAFKVTFFCHTATNEARSSNILVQKLLLLENCRNECVKELKLFSLQLQILTNEYSACGFFSLNLKFFTTVISLIVSYIIIMIQIT